MSSVLTVANLLTILRLIMIPVFVTAAYYQKFDYALGVFFAAAITDGLDGLVARALNQKTQLGAILDPMAENCCWLRPSSFCRCHGLPSRRRFRSG